MHGRQKLLLALTLAPIAIAPALAGPNGATVVNGNATIQGQGTNAVTINQTSQNAIINFQTFNIGTNESVKILMPNSNSTELDRVIGNLGPSLINGSLTSNGRVFLVNPNGILFGEGAQVNVGSLLATTSNISNADFMAGRYNFNIPGNPSASIVNQGNITAQTGGFAALVAPGVRNTGTITAWLGRVGLASANSFSLDLYGDRLIQLDVNDSIASQVIDVSTGKPLKSLVSNEGTLRASGGRVELSAVAARHIIDSVINNSGVIEANSIGTHNGMIVLSAATGASKPAGAPAQTIKIAGKLSAAGEDPGTTGGTVVISGENIALNGAKIDASGANGGGTVLIGGNGNNGNGNSVDAGGSNSSSANTSSANTGNATGSNNSWVSGIGGTGGWSSGNANSNRGTGQSANSAVSQNASHTALITSNASNVTIDAATVIDASATLNGNGGRVTVWSDGATLFYGTILARGGAQSGDGGFVETSGHTLAFVGTVDTSAPNGKTGTWLLDPTDLIIDATAALHIQTALDGNNVTLQTFASGPPSGPPGTTGNTNSSGNGDIIVNAAISWNTRNTLTLDAYNAIIFNASITVRGNGGLVLTAANNPLAPPAPLISFNNGASVQFTGTPGRGQSLTIDGQGYTLLYSMSDVQNVNSNLSGHYALALTLDASTVSSWTPIGTGSSFTGTFQGLGNTISNLTIDQPSASFVGLFGLVGKGGLVQNVGLVGGSVMGNFDVGALVGENDGTVANAYATAAVNGLELAGGLIGFNTGTVTQSYASGPVVSGGFGGGLAGVNSGSITQSYATGPVSGNGAAGEIGGLVGLNETGATISDSYAIGNINGNGAFATGGLVGDNAGAITGSYAIGPVTNGASFGFYVGGLVGTNDFGGSITQSYATGSVTGTGNGGTFFGAAGGLVGLNSGTISQSYATGPVTVDAFWTAGGLVGINGDLTPGALITDSYSTSAVFSSGIDVNLGGLVGINLPGAVISNSQALGNVTSTANLQSNNGINCLVTSDCQFVDVGGFVGSNYGTINGTAWVTRPGTWPRRHHSPARAVTCRSVRWGRAAVSLASTRASSASPSPRAT